MKISSLLAGVASLVLLGSTAFADVMTSYTQSYNGYFGNPSSIPMTFSKFDTALGTLNSVRLDITLATSGGSYQVTNQADVSGSGTLTFGASLSMSSTAVTLLDSSFQPPATIQSQSTSGVLSVTGSSGPNPSAIYYNPGTSGSLNSFFVNSIFLSGYEHAGGGTFNLVGTANQVNNASGFGGVTQTIEPLIADAEVTITYDYSPGADTPEPGTVMMSLIPILGAASIGLRRKGVPTEAVKGWVKGLFVRRS